MSVTFTYVWLTALDKGSKVAARLRKECPDVLIITMTNALSLYMTPTEPLSSIP